MVRGGYSGGEDFMVKAKLTAKPSANYAAFKALDPFFDVVQRGLREFVDGEHSFDEARGRPQVSIPTRPK
jgi:hypothetical protein